MGCFGCFGSSDSVLQDSGKLNQHDKEPVLEDAVPSRPNVAPKVTPEMTSSPSADKRLEPQTNGENSTVTDGSEHASEASRKSDEQVVNGSERHAPSPIQDQLTSGAPIAAQTFTFKELERATKSFSQHNFVGEGGFGRVYKGRLESTGQIVAVKQLDRNGLQGNREFLVEVLMLSLLHHTNLVNLIGYCADGDQRLLVYEFMANGALEDHLHDLPENKDSLDWNMRMRVAAGAAKGLEYLHEKANPPVIYRDFKSSNILLDEEWHPKLSDFGLAKLGPVGDKTHVSTRVMGTYGYCAPEYAMTGQLTVKSDVYSFGVVLLELITGRKAIDNTRSQGEHNLVAWARPLFKDRRKFPAMADPLLQGRYPMRGLYQALAVAAMCLQEQASQRPMIHDVVTALSYLAAQKYDPVIHPIQPRFPPGTPQHDKKGSKSPLVRLAGGQSPRQSPDLRQFHHHKREDRQGSASPNVARGYRESPGRPGMGGGGSARATPNHQKGFGENWRAGSDS